MATVDFRDYDDENDEQLDEIEKTNWNDKFRRKVAKRQRKVDGKQDSRWEGSKFHRPARVKQEPEE